MIQTFPLTFAGRFNRKFCDHQHERVAAIDQPFGSENLLEYPHDDANIVRLEYARLGFQELPNRHIQPLPSGILLRDLTVQCRKCVV